MELILPSVFLLNPVVFAFQSSIVFFNVLNISCRVSLTRECHMLCYLEVQTTRALSGSYNFYSIPFRYSTLNLRLTSTRDDHHQCYLGYRLSAYRYATNAHFRIFFRRLQSKESTCASQAPLIHDAPSPFFRGKGDLNLYALKPDFCTRDRTVQVNGSPKT